MARRYQIFKRYGFQFRHLLVLLIIIVFFQILVSIVHKTSLQDLLLKTQNWYQRDQAENMANLTTASLELLLETTPSALTPEEEEKIIQAFNIILSQQLLQQNVLEICLIVTVGDSLVSIDDGEDMYNFFIRNEHEKIKNSRRHEDAVRLYGEVSHNIVEKEHTQSIREGEQTFHVFVPFVPKGELSGAVYVKNTPDFSFITREIIASFDEITLIFASLIFLGLLAMFYISSYTVKERDETQKMLFKEKEEHLAEQIHHRKEGQFTRRIYHTHHKAEKIMGFIKEDLRLLQPHNIEQIKFRVNKYANFISRVIYDMKWYDPPIQSIRNPIFRTNLNEVINFIVDNIFSRISTKKKLYNFDLQFDANLPPVHINEFVVWEILEPLLQNSVQHSGKDDVIILVRTMYLPEINQGRIIISDNGNGVPAELLEKDSNGLKKIFKESISTKANVSNSGYGCYIAHEIATQRCNWTLDAENLAEGGAQFSIIISNLNH